jgi:GNAT superfamily N-acetyltransferase
MEGARVAEPADLDRLGELLSAAIAATPQVRGGHLYGRPQRNRPVNIRLSEALEAPNDQLLLCGTIDNYVVGLALVSLDSINNIETVGVVEELYVEPDARNVGVGEALVDTAVEWCKTQGCQGIDMPALPGDRATKNLCERSGFTARAIWMHRRI